MRQKIIVCCVLGALFIFGVFAKERREQTQDPTLPQAQVEQMELPAPAATQASTEGEAEKETLDGGGYYVLKAYMNRLAVYRVYPDGTQALADLIDMDIRVLPKHDIESLQAGIVLRSNEALLRILEDFAS